tara:strand:+ start:190 stop:486 length:297 start_codon:yes stop_codon:yes gene_type:complete
MKLQDLEKDLLFFYDYLLFLKETENEDTWLNYTGVYINAIKLLSDLNMNYGELPKKFNKKNFISNYIKLSKKFRLEDFKHNIFMLQEIKIRKNKWILT